MAIISKVHRGLLGLLEKVLIFVEVILALRLVLKFLTANPDAWIVNLLYQTTQILIWPFNFIFPNAYLGRHLFDVVALSAMIGYLILFFLAQWFLRLIWKE
ncbi:MAG: hypothetical protein UY23_C0001G0406 [Candidatus Jorgensenbacteria bacterium GW2011_GWA1_48_11]|uniref:YGGT family protein n=1 Tax=Candidatus Jorgensenbacteria bacterium GW2011_GWA1_48_11 TaxID=1618660 RepID=A0A0G1XBW8_9BACT|nr:MAG: hypothetical protein UY23_C0001G0406 [Candidatus Jorgensenbacteria bacterium GW2011_GWA1_48_11]KKW12291.1 MAG: hypothetical protein UY51_C0005G0533 [Candidatus Jorgensenbacteria bacterium GW2011_GWB1_49_9]